MIGTFIERYQAKINHGSGGGGGGGGGGKQSFATTASACAVAVVGAVVTRGQSLKSSTSTLSTIGGSTSVAAAGNVCVTGIAQSLRGGSYSTNSPSYTAMGDATGW